MYIIIYQDISLSFLHIFNYFNYSNEMKYLQLQNFYI